MKDKIKSFFKVSDEDILMIVLAFMSFSFGIWTNYRQLWLKSVGFNLTQISRILSVALICSAIISFIISLFSTQVKVKNVLLLSMVLRAISLVNLFCYSGTYFIKLSMLICIMAEVMFSIGFYPLLSTVNKNNDAYRKQNLINYVAKDAGVIVCGLSIGVVIGKIVFDYNTCLFLAAIFNLIAICVLLLFSQNKDYKKEKNLPIKDALKSLFKSKINNLYLLNELVVNTSYGIVFGLMMLILTSYINFSVSFASVFIIVCNVLGSIACSFFIRYGKNLSVKVSNLIKYGSRIIFYLLAFLTNSIPLFIISIMVAYITSRILDDKVNGTYIRKVDTKSQFLFGNMRYFVLSAGEGIGTYIAGSLLQISLRTTFLAAAFVTLIQTLMFIFLDNVRISEEKQLVK